MAIDDPIGQPVDADRGWDALPARQLDDLWRRCAESPYATLPEASAGIVESVQGAGPQYFGSAFQRSGDWSAPPRLRYFHRWGAAARARLSLQADSPFAGALGPGVVADGVLRLSLLFGAGDYPVEDKTQPLPVLGVALKLPVFRAPSLNLLLLDSAASDEHRLNDTFGRPLRSFTPSATGLPPLSPLRRFAALEADRRSVAALNAMGVAGLQTVERLSVDRWGAVHPGGAAVPTPAAPWALEWQHRPEIVSAFTALTENDLRVRLMAMSAGASEAKPLPWATLSAMSEAGDRRPLGELHLRSPFLCSAFIDTQLHFKHGIGGMA